MGHDVTSLLRPIRIVYKQALNNAIYHNNYKWLNKLYNFLTPTICSRGTNFQARSCPQIITPVRFLSLVSVAWQHVYCPMRPAITPNIFVLPIFTFTALFFMCSVLSIRPYLDTIQMTSIFICHFPYTINQTPKADKSVPNSAFKNLFLISEILKL